MKVKQLAVAIALAGMIGSQILFATEEMTAENTLSTHEMNFVFEDFQSIELASLSSSEMDKTEGAWLVFPMVGGVAGAIDYYFDHTWDSFLAIYDTESIPVFSSGDFFQSTMKGVGLGGLVDIVKDRF